MILWAKKKRDSVSPLTLRSEHPQQGGGGSLLEALVALPERIGALFAVPHFSWLEVERAVIILIRDAN